MLSIVATPIGNLEDLSIRQARIISEADVILCEDTRSAGMLLQKIPQLFTFAVNPQQKLLSYYKEKEFEKLPQVMELLEDPELKVVLMSESGLPVISDPGLLLVRTLVKRKIPFTVIPGSTAFTTAFVYSGFESPYLFFVGFLPKKESALLSLINKFKAFKQIIPDASITAYESPQRLQETLKLLDTHWPDVKVAICRELTKKFEEISRGTPAELIGREYKGEITLVLQ